MTLPRTACNQPGRCQSSRLLRAQSRAIVVESEVLNAYGLCQHGSSLRDEHPVFYLACILWIIGVH